MLKIITREFGILASTFIFCYISHKFDSYNTMTIYLLVRIWLECRLGGDVDDE